MNTTIEVTTQHSAGYWGLMLGVYGRDEVFHEAPVTILTADGLTITVDGRRSFYRIGDWDAGEVTCDQPASATTHDVIVAFWMERIVELAQLRREIVATSPNPEPEPPAPMEVVPVNIPVTASPAGTLQVGGYAIAAPTFRDAAQFDRAIGRAFADGLRVTATSRIGEAIVTNARTGARYRTTRTSCTCDAGQHGQACKHIAAVCFFADVLHELPTPAAA